jgi:hypothetical protein
MNVICHRAPPRVSSGGRGTGPCSYYRQCGRFFFISGADEHARLALSVQAGTDGVP